MSKYSDEMKQILLDSYSQSTSAGKEEVTRLSRATGLNRRQVRNWFHNRNRPDRQPRQRAQQQNQQQQHQHQQQIQQQQIQQQQQQIQQQQQQIQQLQIQQQQQIQQLQCKYKWFKKQ
jgi:NAD(P)H-dependent flavin oxidoreductase YrpB (nitropropane dioxygenase family)